MAPPLSSCHINIRPSPNFRFIQMIKIMEKTDKEDK